jgi:hypothetical protein
MSTMAICPCGALVHPAVIFNPPGLAVIRYRAGDFISFGEALLRRLDGEQALRAWRPGASGDLGVQMLEWWAYVADVLTFYNERIANQDYLGTADLPESVQGLIRILGYRPRPGIGATGFVAAIVNLPKPITIPAGFPIQSKPAPGKQPQTFETDIAAQATPELNLVPADAPGDEIIGSSILLAGTVAGIKPGDGLLLIKRGWAGVQTDSAVVTLQGIAPQKDPRGKTNTRVSFTAAPGLGGSPRASGFRLLRSGQSTGLWPYKANSVVVGGANPSVALASISRQIRPGDPIVFDVAGSTQAVSVISYTEAVWFTNPLDADHPDKPNPSDSIPIPIPHSIIGFTPALTLGAADNIAGTVVRFDWRDVGVPIAVPAAQVSGTWVILTAAAGAAFPPSVKAKPVLVEDGAGDGAQAIASTNDSGSTVTLTGMPSAGAPLIAPFNVLFNVLAVSRGQTVAAETLGSGDARTAGQEFVLKKSPLTYLASSDSTSGEGYKSTLRVFVNGVEWQEVPSFYGQRPDATVFVTREDESNKTHVQFGDGVNGARLPSGTSNVTAAYRYGGGADIPASSALTVITKPLPNLSSIHNPVPPAGGADPDSPARIRKLAPASVLTFGRAISADDYEVIAAQTPGVARARAYWSFDAVSQRTLVTVYVGDTPGAVAAAKSALAGAADPNRPVLVLEAVPITAQIAFSVRADPRFHPDSVTAGAEAALLDPGSGLFGLNKVRIGQLVFRSQIYDACLRVPGVLAVHSLRVNSIGPGGTVIPLSGPRFFPGEGGFFQLPPENLTIAMEGAAGA